jgi:hypothetical protein
MKKEQFVKLHQSLVRIFSKFSSLFRYSTPEYLAFEIESDILATLISGEQYIIALTDLKYYPSLTVFSRRNFLGRAVRCPVLMRVLVCSFTACLAWGLGEHTSVHFSLPFKDPVLSGAIKSVREEDLFAESIILLLLEKSSGDLEKILSAEQSVASARKTIARVRDYLEALELYAIPSVIKMILEERIIQRLKKFVKYDFYGTSPDSCYYDVSMAQVNKTKRLTYFTNELFVKTPEADRTRKLVRSKIKLLEKISFDLEHERMTTGEPRDIVACLSSLQEKTGFEDFSHAALASIIRRKQ